MQVPELVNFLSVILLTLLDDEAPSCMFGINIPMPPSINIHAAMTRTDISSATRDSIPSTSLASDFHSASIQPHSISRIRAPLDGTDA